MSKQSSFKDKVFEVVKNISRGSTMTYAEVARRAGSPRAFRAVGSILKTNFDTNIPCHRVIRSNGTAGEYNRGAKNKLAILREEGVMI